EANVNGIQQTVSDPVNGLVTQVSTLASGFNVLAKDFEDMEIGGRNLLRNSEGVKTGGSVKSYPFTFEGREYLLGKTITISFYARLLGSNANGNSIDAYLRGSGIINGSSSD